MIYLQKSANPTESRFLNDLYRVNLKLTYSPDTMVVRSDVYLCLHSINTRNFPDELNMVQFESNLVEFNAAVQNFIDLRAVKIGPFKSRIKYFLHPGSQTHTRFTLEPLDNERVRLAVKRDETNDDVLVDELVLVAYDEIRFPDFKNQYESIRRLAVSNRNRLIHFSTRVRVFYDVETHVNDQSAERIDDVFKFRVTFRDLVNNSVIGYLPSVYELTSSDTTNLVYEIANSNVDQSCFKVNKYDGIIYYSEPTPKSCLTSYYPIKFSVHLGSHRHVHVLIYDKPSAPLSPGLLQLDQNSKLTPSNLNFEINLNYLGNFDYNLDESLALANLIPDQTGTDRRVKFRMVTKTDVFSLDTKQSRLYIRKDALMRQNQINDVFLTDNRCFNLDISSTQYTYPSSNRRRLLSSSMSTVSVCFYLSKSSNQSELFLIPVELSALTNFEMLIKARSLTGYVPMVWYFTLAIFSFIFALLVLYLIYNSCMLTPARSKVNLSSSSKINNNLHANYENLETKYSNTSKYSSTSSSYYENDNDESIERRNQLRIRSDHPSIRTGESLNDGLNQISAETYGFLINLDR